MVIGSRGKEPKKQLLEVISRFDLQNKIMFLIRCLLCNTLLQTIGKDQVKHLVPNQTTEYYEVFYICKHCNKIFWEGSHYKNMTLLVEFIRVNFT